MFRIECGACLQELGLRDQSNVKAFNQCKINYNVAAVQLGRSTEVILEETVCHDVEQEVCDNHWVIDEKGDKVWQEDPSTCKTFEVTKCEQVPVPKTSRDFFTAMVSKPFEICCKVVRDECEIKHSKEPHQQELIRYEEVCDVPENGSSGSASVLSKSVSQQEGEVNEVNEFDEDDNDNDENDENDDNDDNGFDISNFLI